MIECTVYLHLPLKEYPYISIMRYSFDPCLKVGDRVSVVDLKWDKITENSGGLYVEPGILASFEALVTIRKYCIDYKRKNTILLEIGLEMADKELLPKLVEIINNNPEQSN